MIERIIRFSIDARYLILVMAAMVAAYGWHWALQLPIDAVPDITNNQVQINTEAPGFSPEEVEKQITFPIENALKGIAGLESTRSLSRNNFSQVTVVFEDHVNIYFARQQILEKLGEAREFLPPEIDPIMGPVSTGLGEVVMWSVEYDSHAPLSTPGPQKDGSYITPEGEHLLGDARAGYLREVEDWIVAAQLRGVKGLAEVDAIGGFVKEYHVQPDFMKLQAHGLTLHDLEEALQHSNLSIGAGIIESHGEAYLVKAEGRLSQPEQVLDIVLGTKSTAPIHLRDVAHVAIGHEQRSGSATKEGNEVVIGTAMMRVGSNSRTVARDVVERLDTIAKSLPPGIRIEILLDRTTLVDSTVHTVLKNLAEGAGLVILVLFLTLNNLAAASIVALIIPLSMLMAGIGMGLLGISGNLMSLGAIDFGLIVDGAVIITENVLRHLMQKTKTLKENFTINEKLDEIKISTVEVIKPSVFGQAIIMAVYLPILTLQGIEGKMFRPMAAVVLLALASAFILSLTYIPAALSVFLSPKKEEKEGRILLKLKSVYKSLLESAIHVPGQVLGLATAVLAFSALLFFTLGQEFVPTLDEHDIAIQVTRIPSTALTQSTKMQKEVEIALGTLPEVRTVFSKTGTAEMASDPMPPDASDTFTMLHPKSKWPNPSKSKEDLIAEMEAVLEPLIGNNFEFTQPIEMRFNELIAGVKSDVAVKIFGDDFETLSHVGDSIAQVLKTIPGSADIIVEPVEGMALYDLKPDAATLSRFGIHRYELYRMVQAALGGLKVGDIRQGDRRFDLVVKLSDPLREDENYLETLPIHTPQGSVPLREVAVFEMNEGLNQISREEGKRRLVVQSNVRGRDVGSFVDELKEKIDTQVKLPTGYWIMYGGEFEHLVSGKKRLMVVVPAALILVLALLFWALRSLRLSLIVFSGVPLALTGGIAALWIIQMPFSISAAVGLIALSGIAVLNALVLMSAIQRYMEHGLNLHQAVIEGCVERLRPVLITAFVASLGFLPMALSQGAGAEVQRPLAIVVIGGLISSTFLTLIVLPSLAVYFEKKN